MRRYRPFVRKHFASLGRGTKEDLPALLVRLGEADEAVTLLKNLTPAGDRFAPAGWCGVAALENSDHKYTQLFLSTVETAYPQLTEKNIKEASFWDMRILNFVVLLLSQNRDDEALKLYNDYNKSNVTVDSSLFESVHRLLPQRNAYGLIQMIESPRLRQWELLRACEYLFKSDRVPEGNGCIDKALEQSVQIVDSGFRNGVLFKLHSILENAKQSHRIFEILDQMQTTTELEKTVVMMMRATSADTLNDKEQIARVFPVLLESAAQDHDQAWLHLLMAIRFKEKFALDITPPAERLLHNILAHQVEGVPKTDTSSRRGA